jgi:hypothetical protein
MDRGTTLAAARPCPSPTAWRRSLSGHSTTAAPPVQDPCRPLVLVVARTDLVDPVMGLLDEAAAPVENRGIPVAGLLQPTPVHC